MRVGGAARWGSERPGVAGRGIGGYGGGSGSGEGVATKTKGEEDGREQGADARDVPGK